MTHLADNDTAWSSVTACCANLYGDPAIELIAGDSLHPGGLATTRALLQKARLRPRARLLDAGCGLGASSRLAALSYGLRVDACDVSPAALQRARALAEAAGAAVRFREASVTRLPFPGDRYDAVLAECVLSTTNKGAALDELRRVTSTGGVLLVSDVTSEEQVDLPDPIGAVLCLTGAWGHDEFDDLLTASRFRIETGWDESLAIGALLDRIETRVTLLAAIRRDLRLDRFHALGLNLAPTSVADVFRDVRRLLAEGRIGYRALLARAI
jgi:arsenite methyltransferase